MIVRRVSGWAFSGSLVLQAYQFVKGQPLIVSYPYLWILVAVPALVVYILVGFPAQMQQGADRLEVCVRTSRLRKHDATLFEMLHVSGYHSYYHPRPEDERIRTSLKDRGGVRIVGTLGAGKTRSALEVVAALRPHAWLVAVRNPDTLTSENIRGIVVPAIFVWWGKPEIVLLLDDATQFVGKPVDSLVKRLLEQCSRFAVVVTYRTGPDEGKLFADPQFEHLLDDRLSTAVQLLPLDPAAADEIYAHVWQGKVGPLIADKSSPGAIVLGLDAKIQQYAHLPNEQRRLLTALQLTIACGARPCTEDFLWMVAEAVWGLSPGRHRGDLEELQRQQYVRVSLSNDRREVIPVSDRYLDVDHVYHYSNLADYKGDLRKLEDLLVRERLTRRLADLGVFYWSALQDLLAARRALESAVRGDPKDRPSALALARLYGWLGEPDRAKTMIETLRDSIADPDEKAETVLAFADEILYGMGQPEIAATWYSQALELAKGPLTRGVIAQRTADCFIKTGSFARAEELYRTCEPQMNGLFISARIVLALLGQNKTEDARTRLSRLWDETDARGRSALSETLLDSAEGCFRSGEAALDATRDLVWEQVVRSSIGANDLLAFASAMLNAGFLDSAARAYDLIVQQAERLTIDVPTLQACYINLSATYRDQGRLAEARSSFQQALDSLDRQPFSALARAAAEAGLADCDLIGGGDLALARERYERARQAGERAADAWVRTWGMLGLGDVLVKERHWGDAERMYRDIELLPTNCGGETRWLLGLGLSCSRLGKLDDAQMYLARGLRRCNRRSYAARQQQFLAELSQLVAAGQLPSTRPVM
jgi:tetratricopeptide (TPR) repeat protein